VSRNRDHQTTPIPRAVTPRDEVLHRALAQVREQGGEWSWAEVMLREQQTQRGELDDLREDKAKRDKAFGGLKKWLAGSWLVAALALGGGLVDYGTRRGRSEADAAAAVKARKDLDTALEALGTLRTTVAEQARDLRALERLFDRRLGDPP
jgi:hypothetical protein